MGFISCGKCEKTYIFFFLFYFLTMIMLSINLFYVYGNVSNFENYSNILVTLLIYNFGQIFCFIPEIILKNISTEKEEEKFSLKNSLLPSKKEKNKLAIEYIFNDFSDTIIFKDIIFIFISSILLLIADFINIEIQINNIDKVGDQLILNEQYNFAVLSFIVIFAYLLYRMKFYKHQIYSVLIILFLGIFRYILKVIYYYGLFKATNLFRDIVLQVIAAIFESIVIIYSKALMEYKFFSPYKVCYIFGTINSIIIILLLIIFNFIKTNSKNWFFALEYEGYYYVDNIKSIFENYGYKLIALFFASIFLGALKLFVNLTINKYTVCHVFLLLQNKETCNNISEEMATKKGFIYVILIFISHFIDFFIILVFLEIIELNFCDLNKNLKRNIKNRADDETRQSIENIRNNSDINERNESLDAPNEEEEEKNK